MNILHLYYLDPGKRSATIQYFADAKHTLVFDLEELPADQIDALFVGAQELTATDLAQFPNLKCIQVLGQRTELIDSDYCQANHIQLLTTNAPKGHIIAEHALGLALSGLRNFNEADRLVRAGFNPDQMSTVNATETAGADNWPQVRSRTLFGAKVGIVGLGTIGLELLHRLQAFGCQISYFRRTPFCQATNDRLGIQSLPLNQLLTASDVLFFHLPHAESTIGLIDAAMISLIPKGTILINCGRAAVFEESALMAAIQSQHIGFAGLDVFWQEPLPTSHPLCQTPNVTLTPHMAEMADNQPDPALLRREAMDRLIQALQRVL